MIGAPGKKRILFVTNHFRYSNGVASVLRSMIHDLNEEKYDISLLALYDIDMDFAAPVLNKITLVKGFGGYFRGMDKLVNLIPPKVLYRHFVREKYDLEVAYQFGMPTKMIAMGDNPNRICWMHGFDEKIVLGKYYPRFKKVITVAKAGATKLIEKGFEKEKCGYLYNVIDDSAITDLANKPCSLIKTHRYAVATVGRLAPDKAFMRYLECLREIHYNFPDAEFWIIGGGSEEQNMRAYIDENHMDEYVKMTGPQKNPYPYLANADLYFCCSYREGFSTACQEAAIVGVPVLSVEVDGARELIELVGCGDVVPNDKRGIVDGITNALAENLPERWREAARQNKVRLSKVERIADIERELDRFLG